MKPRLALRTHTSGVSQEAPGFPFLLVACLALTLSPEALVCLLNFAFPQERKETFDEGRLQKSRWEITSDGDFRERAVDVVSTAKAGPPDYRLRVRLDTIGTKDETVKFLGVRSVEKIRLDSETQVSADLDWNDQANGSYLSAGLVLCPAATSGNPLISASWLKVEYIGVPPGRNARLTISVSKDGRARSLFTDGWPETSRGGRKIGLQSIKIILQDRSIQVWENSRLVYDSKENVLPFDTAYLYLQVSSHSNYAAREIYFDNIRVSARP